MVAVRKKNLSGGLHAHGCIRCHVRYEDACARAHLNELCRACRGLPAWNFLVERRRPQRCCTGNTRRCEQDELNTYALSAGCPWFRCRTCCRTHPYTPPEESA